MAAEPIFAVPWRDHKHDGKLIEEMASKMFGQDGIGFNNYAYEECRQRVIPVFKINDLEKIQERLLSRPILFKAVVMKDEPRKASLVHGFHGNRQDFALLMNTKNEEVSSMIKKSLESMKQQMSKSRAKFCVPIDINSRFNYWFKSLIVRQTSFHDSTMTYGTFCAVIYITNVVEAAEGGNTMTRVTRCGKCQCVHDA